MPYVAMVYNPPPEKPDQDATKPAQLESAKPAAEPAKAKDQPAALMQARYLAGLYALPLLGLLLRKQAAQVGMEEAQVWIGLSDAGTQVDAIVGGQRVATDRSDDHRRHCQP